MALIRAASIAYNYDLNLSEIARIWKGGCIIRAKLLDPIRQAFAEQPDLENLLLAPHIAETVNSTQAAARTVIQIARAYGIPTPALSAALDYFDTYRQERLPANLVQGQRDFFGAHTYKRLDRPGTFHTIWTPEGTAETVASAPSRREDDEHTEDAGERAPVPGHLPPGSDEDRALQRGGEGEGR
jgi:6-phosphogluconate dehydrogenase